MAHHVCFLQIKFDDVKRCFSVKRNMDVTFFDAALRSDLVAHAPGITSLIFSLLFLLVIRYFKLEACDQTISWWINPYLKYQQQLLHKSLNCLTASDLGIKHFVLKSVLLLSQICYFSRFIMCDCQTAAFGSEWCGSNINNDILQKDNYNNYLHPTSYSRSQFCKKPAVIFIIFWGTCSSMYH